MCVYDIGIDIGGGIAHRNCQAKKGPWTGRPLSPLLFVIVVDYLSNLVKQAVDNKKIELYISGGGWQLRATSHLQRHHFLL